MRPSLDAPLGTLEAQQIAQLPLDKHDGQEQADQEEGHADDGQLEEEVWVSQGKLVHTFTPNKSACFSPAKSSRRPA